MGLKEFRKKSGLSQSEAADVFGLKYRTYQNYENGVTSPDMETAARFAVYFKCSIGELFDLEEGWSSDRDADEDVLIDRYHELNDEGKERLLQYSADLISSGNYTQE